MYMLTILQLEAYRATGDKKYLDRDATEWWLISTSYAANGLFYHAPMCLLLGRGDGWVAPACGMLRSLPLIIRCVLDHEGYKIMMASLLQYQGKDGMCAN